MLVLSRKQGESIVIDRGISITVVSISRGRVQLGIDAPKYMTVHREEVYRRIQVENAFVPVEVTAGE